ncbi:MAG: carbohydrate ABC transporter permease [Treponema sp.]|jgi:multiple sugar transport system permease protein|nr:carbohydrate ABC transporter permease [Treponema sp.]
MAKLLRYGALLIFMLLTLLWLLPFLWIFLSAFKTYPETVRLPVKLLPQGLYLGNFTELLGRMKFVTYFKNNVIVTLGILIPQVFLSAMAAYGFARLEFPLKNGIFMSLFIALMVPLQMILMPRYNMMLAFGWIDSYLGVIIPCIPSVTVTFFIRQQLMGLPKSLDESAIIDGANHWVIFSRIILPLCKSAILATGLMCMVFAWNLFLWPLIVINNPEWYTLSIGTANLQGQNMTRENLLMTAALLVSAPVIVIFLITQKHFISGVAMTGIKE